MIAVISGTNRPGSNSLKIAQYLASRYETAGEQVRLLDLQDLPPALFTPAAYKEKPAAFTQGFVEPVLSADGLHMVVPEYNGGFPGVAKYFVDMLPFPEAFDGRPAAFTGVSAGSNGALRPVEQMQAVFGYRNAYIYPRRVFLPAVYELLDEDGNVTDESIRERLDAQAIGFVTFTRQLKS